MKICVKGFWKLSAPNNNKQCNTAEEVQLGWSSKIDDDPKITREEGSKKSTEIMKKSKKKCCHGLFSQALFAGVGWQANQQRKSLEKPLRAEKRTNNKLNPHMTLRPGIEPGPCSWEASALTTAPSCSPHQISQDQSTRENPYQKTLNTAFGRKYFVYSTLAG